MFDARLDAAIALAIGVAIHADGVLELGCATLGMRSGLDPRLIHEEISSSGSSSAMFEVRGGLMVENEYYKEGMNFSIPLKDSRLIAEHAAQSLVPTPIYHAALQTYYAAVAQGHGDEDQSAVCAAMERAANCEREKKNQPES